MYLETGSQEGYAFSGLSWAVFLTAWVADDPGVWIRNGNPGAISPSLSRLVVTLG